MLTRIENKIVLPLKNLQLEIRPATKLDNVTLIDGFDIYLVHFHWNVELFIANLSEEYSQDSLIMSARYLASDYLRDEERALHNKGK